MDSSQLVTFALFYPGFLFSLSFHEMAHAWAARRLGDDTAHHLGRITLNPLPHMDPIGTVLLPIAGFFSSGMVLGWGKPVPVNPIRLADRKRDMMFISVVGPLSNLFLAFVLAAFIHALIYFNPQWTNPDISHNGYIFLTALIRMLFLNLGLAVFNMIPIHPLDGGKVLYGLLPNPLADQIDAFLTRFGFMLLLFLLFSGSFDVIVGPAVKWMAGMLL